MSTAATSGPARRVWRRLLGPRAGPALLAVGVGALLVLLTWTPLALAPVGGFDPSGLGALHLGIHDGLSWGRDLIYTYGPLGFLKVPTYWYSDTGTLAVLYAVITRIALFTVLWSLGRRSFGWPGAVAVLLLIGVDIGDPVPVLAFAACLWVLVGEPQRPGRDLGFALAGARGRRWSCWPRSTWG